MRQQIFKITDLNLRKKEIQSHYEEFQDYKSHLIDNNKSFFSNKHIFKYGPETNILTCNFHPEDNLIAFGSDDSLIRVN